MDDDRCCVTNTGISSEVTCLLDSGVQRLPNGEFNLPESVQRYCDGKKVMYCQQSDLPESEWPPILGGTYIRLALIKQKRSTYDHRYELVIEQQIDYTRGHYDKIIKRKTKIELREALSRVFCKGGTELQLRMLIDGAPGVGKTTLSRKVSNMWALGEILDGFWLVLLLHLRESAVSKATTIDELFYHEDPDVQQSVTKFVKEKGGDGVLIIFDGFDELSAYERTIHSLFLDVTKGKILPKCAVVVTSRPYASRSIQELSQINRHIEVLGFTDDQIKTCIRRKIADQDKAEELCAELKDRLDVASICQIPLNCSIMLYVYEQENYHLPRTLTELYDLFILHSLKRFVTRTQNDRAASRLLDLMNLESSYGVCFQSLCNLAVKGLEDNKLVFSQDDVEKCFPSWDCKSVSNPPVLDLMTTAKSYSSRGAHDTYSFLHLTIQEFLAAYQIAHYSSDADKLEFFRKNLLNDRFRMVLLFLSGMTKLKFHDVASIFSQESWNKDPRYICHLTYEAENHCLCNIISENCCNSPKEIELTGSKFDALVVSDFVASSDCTWAAFICGLEHIPVVYKVFSSSKFSCATFIEKVAVACRSDEANNFTLLEHLEKLSQFNQVSIIVELLDGDNILVNENLIKNLGKFLTETRLVWSKQYSLVLKEDYEFDSLTVGAARMQFCNMLSKCLDQNNSIMEVTLNDVLPRDIECILTHFGSKNSVSCLKHLVCRSHQTLYVDEVDTRPHTSSLNSQNFCETLVSFCSRNTSLQEVTLKVALDYEVVRDNLLNIMSALANNLTLQRLTIFEYNSIVFQRNPANRQMEFIHPLWSSYNMSPVFNPRSVGESSNTRSFLSSSLPVKLPCEQNSLLEKDLEMLLKDLEIRLSLYDSVVDHCSPTGSSRFAYSSTPSNPHCGHATEHTQSSSFSGHVQFVGEQYMNPSWNSKNSFQSLPSSHQCSSETNSIPQLLCQTSTITGSNSTQPGCSFHNNSPSHSCPPLVQPMTLSLTSQPPLCYPIQAGTSPFSPQPRQSARYCDDGINLTCSNSDPHLNSYGILTPNVPHQSERPAHGQHSTLNSAVNAPLPSPDQQQSHRVMSGGHNQIQQHQSDMQHDISMPCISSSLTCIPHSGSEALTGQQYFNQNMTQRHDLSIQPSPPQQLKNSQTTWLAQTAQRQSSTTPRVSPCFSSQRRDVYHSAPQGFASTPLCVPYFTSPQQGMHLQQAYTLNQSVTSTTFTTSSVPSPSTHGSPSHLSHGNVPSSITSVEVSPLPLPSRHLSQGASHNQPYQHFVPLLVSQSGRAAATGQQHFSQTVRHQHQRPQFTDPRLSTPIAQLPQVAQQQSFATPHVPPCSPSQPESVPHSKTQTFSSTPVDFPHPLSSPRQGIHLQPYNRLNQSTTCVTSTTFTTSGMPSPSTHSLASHHGQHNVPDSITNVNMNPLPLPWSQHLSQGASYNQPYQQQNIALLSPSGSAAATNQHFSQTTRHQHPQPQSISPRLPIARLPQAAQQQSFATPHVPPCSSYQPGAVPHSTTQGFFNTLV